jgi:hypothetical protein
VVTRLDVGCGRKRRDGYVGLDVRNCGQEYVRDATYGLPRPAKGERWDEVRAAQFLEHLTPAEAVSFLNDCWRKCKELHVVVPHKDCPRAWQLSHKSYYNEHTFRHLETEGLHRDAGIRRWRVLSLETNGIGHIHARMEPANG